MAQWYGHCETRKGTPGGGRRANRDKSVPGTGLGQQTPGAFTEFVGVLSKPRATPTVIFWQRQIGMRPTFRS
jgi:hypothetical protein